MGDTNPPEVPKEVSLTKGSLSADELAALKARVAAQLAEVKAAQSVGQATGEAGSAASSLPETLRVKLEAEEEAPPLPQAPAATDEAPTTG